MNARRRALTLRKLHAKIKLEGWTLTAKEMCGVAIFGDAIHPGKEELTEIDVVVRAHGSALGLGFVPLHYSLRLNHLGLRRNTLGFHGTANGPTWNVDGHGLPLREVG